MDHRERVLTALDHSEPDRVPIDLGGTVRTMTDEAYCRFAKYAGLPGKMTVDRVWRTVQRFDEGFLESLDIDTRYVFLKDPKNLESKLTINGIWFDEWGIGRRSVKHYNEMVVHPLERASIDDLEEFNWPDPYALGRTGGLEKEAKSFYDKTDYAIVAANASITFELSMYLRGIENFLVDMALNKEFAHKLVNKITEVNLGLYEVYLDAVGKYVQVVDIADDLGMQKSAYISSSMYREFIKPSHKKLVELIKSKTNAKVLLHSCGSVSKLIPDLIEVGIDIINPVQPLATGMESDRLKKNFGEKICFDGGVDVQRILPIGTPEDVETEVKRRIRDFAPGGGYILTSSHNIQADVPPGNVVTMFRAAKKYGMYPINI